MSCDAPMDSSSPGDITLRRTAEVKALKPNNKLGFSYGRKQHVEETPLCH